MNALVRIDGHPRRVADLGLPRAAGRRRPGRDRPRALRQPRPRGQRADVGQPAARHRPADRRRERLPALVGAIRPGGRRRLRRPGRDRRGRRRRRQGAPRSGRRTRFPPGRRPANLEAYRSYLKGRHLRGKEDLDGALRAFEEAVRLDPSHAPSWTGLAEITVLASRLRRDPRARGLRGRERRRWRPRAQLQGESADGLHVEAFVAWIERRWAAMETAWRRAIELQPTHVLALALVRHRPLLAPEARRGACRSSSARGKPIRSRPFPTRLTGGGLLGLRKAAGSPALPRGRALLREGGRLGPGQCGHGQGRPGPSRRRHRDARARGRDLAPRAPTSSARSAGRSRPRAGRTRPGRSSRSCERGRRARPPSSPRPGCSARSERSTRPSTWSREPKKSARAYLYFTGLPGFDPLRADPRFGALLARLGLPSA